MNDGLQRALACPCTACMRPDARSDRGAACLSRLLPPLDGKIRASAPLRAPAAGAASVGEKKAESIETKYFGIIAASDSLCLITARDA